MKPIKKEDMPKLILLIVFAVGMFGFALTQFMSNPASSVAATPPTPGTVPAKGSVGGTPTTTALVPAPEVSADPELDFLHIGPPAGGKDPFSPNGPAAPVAAMPAPVVVAPVVRPLPPVAVNTDKGNGLDRLLGIRSIRPNGIDMGMDGSQPGMPNPGPGPAVVELPAPAWTASGIVLAERDTDGIKRGRDVAILRDAAGNRRFVTVGDPVDNGYHVSAVRPGGVEIRNHNRTAMIHLESSAANQSAVNQSTVNPSPRAGGVITNTREISGINGATTRAN